MEERAHALIAIVFIVVFGVGAGLVAWWMMAPSVTRVPYVLDAKSSVAGLGPGSPVNYNGVQVGAVRKIALAPDNRRRIEVRIGINADFPLPKGSYATIAAPGFIGSKVVELSLGSGSANLHTSPQSPAHLPLKPGMMSGLMKDAGSIMGSLKSTLKSARQMLSEKNRKHLSDTLARIDKASAQLVQLEQAVRPTLKHLPGLIASARDTLGAAQQVLEQAKSLAARARKPVEAVGHAASNAGALAMQLNQTTLPRLNALMGRLKSLSTRLESLVNLLNTTPQSLIVGPAPVSPGPGETRGSPHSGG